MAIDGSFAPGPMIVASQLISIRHAVVEREHREAQTMRNLLWGLPVGLIGGVVVLELVSARTLAILVGSLAVVAALLLLGGFEPVRTNRTETLGGALCAFASVTAALPGPPLVMCLHDAKPAALRATIGSFVLFVAAIGFVLLLVTGNFGTHEGELTLWLIPGILAGMYAARWVRPFLDRSWFRPLVLSVALCGGLALVVRQFI